MLTKYGRSDIMYICERCKINKATKKYKTRERITYTSNSFIGYKLHRVCESCWGEIIKGWK